MKLRMLGTAVLALTLGSFAFAGEADHPETLAYSGVVADADGLPLEGVHQLSVRYFAPATESAKPRLLGREQFGDVAVVQGRFELTLGSSSPELEGYPSLQQLFAAHSAVEVEVSVDGRVQHPMVEVLPSGHSPATIDALAGMAPTGVQAKGYNSRSRSSAVRAVRLQPAGAGQAVRAVPGTSWTNPFEINVSYLGESGPLRDKPTIPIDRRPEVEPVEINRPRHGDLYDEKGQRFGTTTEKIRDPLVDASNPGSRGASAPPPILNFEGVGNVNGVLPPDTEGTVGPNHYIQAVNLSFAIYDKAGVLLEGPFNNNTLWSGFGPCGANNDGDPIFVYDEQADRYVLTQFVVSSDAVCFAVSQTPDPTGDYFLYQINTQRFPDYFKVGVWPDPANSAYYLTTNSGFQGQYDVYAIDRDNMLAGNAVRPTQFFQNFPNLFMPADVDGDGPPANQPGLLYTFRDGGEPYFNNPPTDSIDLYEFDVDWTTPANTTFTLIESFIPPDLAPFNWSVCGFFVSNCLPQPGTTGATIDSASWWPMQRFIYRNFGTHETLLGAWTVDVTGTPDLAGVRWFELRRGAARGSAWEIHQQGTHSPDSTHRFMPSIAMDGDGNIGLGYSVTSGSVFPGIRYTTQENGDAAGTMRDEQVLIDGSGVQTSGSSRWGDYAAMEVDPADDCTFWFTSEYIETTGNANWQTRVGTFQVPGCGAFKITPAEQSVCIPTDADYEIELFDAFTGTTNLSVTGCPAGASCSFSSNPIVNPQTMSTLTVSGPNPGDYSFSVTATDNADPLNTRTRELGLSAFAAAPAAPTLVGPANGASDVPLPVLLEWNAPDSEESTVQIATDPGFSNIVASNTGSATSFSVAGLDTSTQYYWRVRTGNACGMSSFSAVRSFTTVPAPGDCNPGSDVIEHFFDDFDPPQPGWSSSALAGPDTWALDTGNPGSGSPSGGNAYQGDDVDEISDQVLVSPPIAIPADANLPTLHLWNYQEMEDGGSACYDGAVLEISTNDGASWARLESELLTDPYDGPMDSGFSNPLAGENAWCGDPQDWLDSVVDLAAFAGETVRFRFRIATDSSVDHPGWWIDDVTVSSCSSEDIFADGFETGDISAWTLSRP